MPLLNRPLRWILGIVAALLLLVVIFGAVTRYDPPPVREAPVANTEQARPIAPGARLKVMTWNVQFMAGNRNNDFFFSGGPDPWPSAETVRETIRQVAEVIREEDPDLVLLQELDIDSKRTHSIDQLAALVELLPDTYTSSSLAYYWKTPFLPHPAIRGRMGMALAVISKYRLDRGTRLALPYEMELDFFTRQYIFKRGVLVLELPLEGEADRKLVVHNTHLSSFEESYHVPTMTRQVGMIDSLLQQAEAANDFALVGGDFNLIPTPESFARVSPDDQKLYHPDRTDLRPLFERYAAVPSWEAVNGPDYAGWYTHSSLKAREKSLDKTIDYLFLTRSLPIDTAYVVQRALPLSDHVPVVAVVRVPSAGVATARRR